MQLEDDRPASAAGENSRLSAALGQLLGHLKAQGYDFTTPTPETHARVIAREERRRARDLRDVFGWNLPFEPSLLAPHLLKLLEEAGALMEEPYGLRSTLRIGSVGKDLYLHSSFPPERDAVFFGPDTYRFVRFISSKLDDRDRASVLLDLGAGAGAGAVVAAKRASPTKVILTDVNPRALILARINLASAGLEADFRCGRDFETLTEVADLIVANPPFIAGDAGQVYSDGGDLRGMKRTIEWALAGSAQLPPGGRMLLYTGVAIVAGRDALLDALQRHLNPCRFELTYEEIDPDIFGECLRLEAYRDVERIAAVGVGITCLR